MARQDLDRFFEMVASDPSLQAELERVNDEGAFIAHAVNLGVQAGCDFTADEIRRKVDELSALIAAR